MTRLYHGSNVRIERIDLSRCTPYKDFGRGFYLTDIKRQAEERAVSKVRVLGEGVPTVTAYEFDERLLRSKSLRVKVFEKVSAKWAQFILDNRINARKNGFAHHYDIVVGPVADDSVAYQLKRYELEMISMRRLIKELEYKNLNNQYYFGTERAIELLRRIDDE